MKNIEQKLIAAVSLANNFKNNKSYEKTKFDLIKLDSYRSFRIHEL